MAEDNSQRERKSWEAPNEPKIRYSEALQRLKVGDSVSGFAPIGVRWSGKVSRRMNRETGEWHKYVKPDGNCPVGEFAVKWCTLDGVRHEVVSDRPEGGFLDNPLPPLPPTPPTSSPAEADATDVTAHLRGGG
jgi:hypothetical protein